MALKPLIIEVDTQGIDNFFGEFMQIVADSVRPAAQAGAQVLYDEVKRNVGQLKSYTGNLNASIYQAYSPELSVEGQSAFYNISWNKKKAPHGWLVERGHLQRYRYYQNAQGQVRPMVRPGMDGRKPPSSKASQAVKDAYYVTLPTPIQIPGKAFIRRAADKRAAARGAMQTVLFSYLTQEANLGFSGGVYGGSED